MVCFDQIKHWLTWSHLPISCRPASVKLRKPVLSNFMLHMKGLNKVTNNTM